jgi:hypothetical protein
VFPGGSVQHHARLVSDVNANVCVSGIMRCGTPTGTGGDHG